MDHSYIWAIEPADEAFVQSLVQSTELTLATKEEVRSGVAGSLYSDWPDWWPQDHIDSLSEHYFRVTEKDHLHVWVDAENDRIYVQWFDT
jgi:hypothetical protein